MSNDSLLNDFLSECREHLEGIETDLLDIEKAGENADPELVNKVFRAAHSIKGGAGFFNLEKIKALGHKTETALDLIRSKKLKPDPEAINILLAAFDLLRDLVNNTDAPDRFDIAGQVNALQELASSHLASGEKDSLHRTVTVTSKDDAYSAVILQVDLQAACAAQQYIYLIDYDMVHDIDNAGMSVVKIMNALAKMGVIIDTKFDIAAVGTLDDQPSNRLPLQVIYRTVLDQDLIDTAVLVPKERIHLLHRPQDCEKYGGVFPKPPHHCAKYPSNQPSPTQTSADAGSPSTPVKEKKGSGTKKGTREKKATEVAPVEMAPVIPMEKPTETPPEPEQPKTAPSASAPAAAPSAAAPDTLRVAVESLDTLMTQAGELVLGRNQLLDAISRQDQRAIIAAGQRISFVTSELQEAVMRTRLQPVGNVFNKFTRVVRDMAIALKKEVRLEIEGKDVELDKTIIEGLSDPLTHMVRNAVDHGIESPVERQVKGKPVQGTVRLRAYHEAGQVTIELGDDGKGLDSNKIATKAVQMRLITQERLAGMSDDEKRALIFLPGLSTAEKVTETSGRGVGMDVVKTNLDRLGGKVEIRSEVGKGTTFRIKLPLTLAIIPSLIISENRERYAMPQVNVVELHRIPSAQIRRRIGVVGDAEVLVLRGELIPLVRFSEVLGIVPTYIDPATGKEEIDRRKRIADRRSKRIVTSVEPHPPAPSPAREGEGAERAGGDRRFHAVSDLNIVIVSSGLLQYGLVVDQLHHTEEIVVKPLGRHLKGLGEYAGATIMGDGDVALILDATGIALKADIASVSAASKALKKTQEVETSANANGMSLLLFDNEPGEQCAVHLDLVQRVERVEKTQIETKGGRRTMQYRGALLPLMQLSDVANVNPVPLDGDLAVVVTTVAGHDVGVLGRMPVSVVESNVAIDTQTHRQQGISGSAIIAGKTVLMIDVFGMVDVTHAEWSVKQPCAPDAGAPKGNLVLLAEDSDFFRGMVSRYIEECGYTVLAARDGQEAWELLLQNAGAVRVVVTDIEMPRMTGFELTRALRADERFAALPVIALTSLAGEEDQAKGREAGISDYQVKLDRDRLMEGLQRAMAGLERTVTA
jgi:two-component system chemotaxis sensor kinase CheA